jgi:hypothetical protein
MFNHLREHICIVGNSKSVIGRGKGGQIDDFKNVCRLNDWIVNGYQGDVGTKITHWVTGAGRQIPQWSKNRSLENKYTIVLWPRPLFPLWRKFAKETHNTDGSMYEAVPHIKEELIKRWGYKLNQYSIWKDNNSPDLHDTRDNITFVPEYISERIAVNTVAYPTTGLATIAYFKFILGYNVSTIGFDFFLKNKAHYWDGKEGLQTEITGHTLEEEAEIYEEWVSSGIIEQL